MRRLDAGTRHRSNRPPASSSRAPSALTGEIGAAGPLPAGTPVGKEGWVSVVVCSVMVIAAPGPVVKTPAVEVVVGPVGVVNREAVLGVVLPLAGGVVVEVPAVGLVGVVSRDRVLGVVLPLAGGVVVVVRLVPGVVMIVGPEPGAVEVPVGLPEVLVGEGLLLLVVGAMSQDGALMVLLSRVTAAVEASRRPVTVAPVCAVTEARARTVPTKVELVPRVAELPTCQKTLQEACEVVNLTTLREPVIRVLEAWKMNTAFGFVRLSSVSVPVRLRFPW